MFLQGGNTGFGPRRIYFNHPPERKIMKLLKRKFEWLTETLFHQNKGDSVVVVLISETLTLYRQSEKNCSLGTHQDNLSRLEHSIQRTFSAVSLVHLPSGWLPQLLSVLNNCEPVVSVTSHEKFNHCRWWQSHPFNKVLSSSYYGQGTVWGSELAGYKDK